jgi:Rps23 Pro-64 3,4-dihydroxylase Tpa1-like proline 4-hydroxylase
MPNNYTEINLEKLNQESENIVNQWQNPKETNTKHFFIDNLLSSELCTDIYNSFPKDGDGFFNRNTFREKKKTSVNLKEYNKNLSDISYAIQDPRVVEKIGELLDLKNLEPDPTLYASGLSMMFENDYLNPHIDNSHDAKRNKYRRLNLLYYVSPKWEYDFGGNFELWDEKVSSQKTIISCFNRLLVMETNRKSWHSVSKVAVDRPRCCVSSYFFSNNSPGEKEYFHVTSFNGRPNQNFKRIISPIDNVIRNLFSKMTKFGRGK